MTRGPMLWRAGLVAAAGACLGAALYWLHHHYTPREVCPGWGGNESCPTFQRPLHIGPMLLAAAIAAATALLLWWAARWFLRHYVDDGSPNEPSELPQ